MASEHLRGSTMLLAARFAAHGVELVTQILLVRYLSMADFGAFSYALSIVVLLKTVAILDLPNALARFIPLYRERGAKDVLAGSVALAVSSVAVLGVAIALGLELTADRGLLSPANDPRALAVLVAIAWLIPLEGLDALLTILFATLNGVRQLMVRQLLTPILKFGLVMALVLSSADILFLASGYVVVAAVSLALYAWLLLRALSVRSWLSRWQLPVRYPVRELFGFALPLLTSTLVWMVMESSDAILLGLLADSSAVASFRAVLPIPKALVTLTLTFGVLYAPVAARLYGRGEHDDLAALYRRSALWMTLLSFPIFALTFSFAPSTTSGLYGAGYAHSAAIMALLSLGYYCFVVMGFNGLTLKIYAKLRYSLAIDVFAAILNVALNVVLIRYWGALGAAAGTALTLFVHNVLKQYGLWRYMRINLFERPYIRVHCLVALFALALFGLQVLLPASLLIALPVCLASGLLLVRFARGPLDVPTVFPELMRVPILAACFRVWLK